ncbi:MAG: PD-(D/E)XK nuclease family protein [Candidatus Marinimicrobia bacterium]|nr:PD-(D/E)XK nuclease family protein [Candidatus Neomarinimicrobiota bacterium]
MSTLERFSYSGLESYKKCPAQFKFRYIDFIRKPDEGIEAFMGKRVHEALEFLYKEVQSGRIPIIDSIHDYYKSIWTEKWHDRIAIAKRGERKEDYFRLGEDCIARFYRKNQPFAERVEGIELEMDFMLGGDDSYRMKGIMDRLDHDGNGKFEIHDYKTGKRALSQGQADKDGQLALYQIALEQQRDDVKDVTLVWHFVRYGIEIRSKRTMEQLQLLSTSMQERINEIRLKEKEGADFPPKPMILCNWCYYWEECPAQHGTNPYIR